MKNMKPVVLRLKEPLEDGYRLFPVADQWSEALPARMPLRYAIFRYLGFFVTETKKGKTTVLKSRAVGAVCVRIQNEEKEIFSDRVGTCFRNGVFYVQDLHLDNAGVHTVTVTVDGQIASQVKPLVLQTEVYEFMELRECPDLQSGVYAPLRDFVCALMEKGEQEQLRDDGFIENYLKHKTFELRNMDARWWLKAFVEQAMDREMRRKLLQMDAAVTALLFPSLYFDDGASVEQSLLTCHALCILIVSEKLVPDNTQAKARPSKYVRHLVHGANNLPLYGSSRVSFPSALFGNHKTNKPTGRTADRKEHENLFDRRRREWKRVRNGEIRMFTTEPLHGTKAYRLQPSHLA